MENSNFFSVLTPAYLKEGKIPGVPAKRQTIEQALAMFDDYRVCGVKHSDAAVVLLIQKNYPVANLNYDGNVDDPKCRPARSGIGCQGGWF